MVDKLKPLLEIFAKGSYDAVSWLSLETQDSSSHIWSCAKDLDPREQFFHHVGHQFILDVLCRITFDEGHCSRKARKTFTCLPVVLTSKPRVRASFGVGVGLALPNGSQLASLEPGPDERARASFWVGPGLAYLMRTTVAYVLNAFMSDEKLKILAIILEHGADPNELFHGASVWMHILKLCRFFSLQGNASDLSPDCKQRVFSTLSLFIATGAVDIICASAWLQGSPVSVNSVAEVARGYLTARNSSMTG